MNLPNETRPCSGCGKKMVPCWTFLFQETPTSLGGRWEWWCRCGLAMWGGSATDGDARERWENANTAPGHVATEKHCGNLPGETEPCKGCGKQMVWSEIFTGKWSDYPKGRRNWVWWCKCQARETGSFHGYWPNSPSGAKALRRWENANAKPVAARPKEHCAFCRFFERHDCDVKLHTCRRYAPITVREVARDGSTHDRTHFPKMWPTGWCGDFERVAQEP